MGPFDPQDPTSAHGGAQPPDVETLLDRASVMIERSRWAEAERLLGEGLALDPRHPDLMTELARVRYLQDAYTEALHLLRGVLAQEPSHLEARHLLSMTLSALEQFPEAEAVILQLLRDYPGSATFLATYARLMLRTLQVDKARALVAEALRRDPDNRSAIHAAALSDIVEGPGSGNSALQRLLKEHPDSHTTLSLVIGSMLQQGQVREAHRLSKDVLRASPDDPDALQRVKLLARESHWALIPLWPLQRWGWPGAVGCWAGAIAIGRLVDVRAPEWSDTFWLAWLAYAAYSWIAPPLVRHFTAR